MAFRALRWVVLAALLHLGSSSSSSTGSATNEAIPKPECDDSLEVGFSYANDIATGTTTGPLSIVAANTGERGGCITVVEIWEAFGASSPLYPVDPDSGALNTEITGTWLLEEDLTVQDGITLQVWGPDSGGDVIELRLKTDSATSDTDATFVKLEAYGGSLDFESTKVVGWSTVNNTYAIDTDDGRSYISAISDVIDESACDQGEARMDVVNSEMAYMGYREILGGLRWQANGVCQNESTSVYGNVYDSELHNMVTAVHMRGHKQGDVSGNVLHSNIMNGIWAEDDSNFLTIHDNSFEFSGDEAATTAIRISESSNPSIQNNIVNGGRILRHGINLDLGSDFAVVTDNQVYDVTLNGIYLQQSSDAEISNNEVAVARDGVLLTGGSDNNVVSNNLFANISSTALITRYSLSGRPDDNLFDSNTILERARPFQISGAHGVRLINNVFSESRGTSDCSNSTNVVLTGNVGLVGQITLSHVGFFDMH